MSATEIRLEHLGVCFDVERYRATTLKQWLTLRAKRWLTGQRTPPFWALRNVGFALSTGDRLAVMGPNGSGKSTLMRVLAGMYRPDAGRIWIAGRTCSLLALGAGFEPDLSGRDNVLLNGLLLGLTAEQIRDRYDTIVDFAGLGDFMDTPVKAYSSGMVSRLGFAVAMAVEPDVLLLDEVLSVGDAAFVAKAEKALAEMRNRARCQIIVTHDFQFMLNNCNKGLYLVGGQVRYFGSCHDAVKTYCLDIYAQRDGLPLPSESPASRPAVNATGSDTAASQA